MQEMLFDVREDDSTAVETPAAETEAAPAAAPEGGLKGWFRAVARAHRRGASTLDYMIVAAIIGLICYGIMNSMGETLQALGSRAMSAIGSLVFG